MIDLIDGLERFPFLQRTLGPIMARVNQKNEIVIENLDQFVDLERFPFLQRTLRPIPARVSRKMEMVIENLYEFDDLESIPFLQHRLGPIPTGGDQKMEMVIENFDEFDEKAIRNKFEEMCSSINNEMYSKEAELLILQDYYLQIHCLGTLCDLLEFSRIPSFSPWIQYQAIARFLFPLIESRLGTDVQIHLKCYIDLATDQEWLLVDKDSKRFLKRDLSEVSYFGNKSLLEGKEALRSKKKKKQNQDGCLQFTSQSPFDFTIVIKALKKLLENVGKIGKFIVEDLVPLEKSNEGFRNYINGYVFQIRNPPRHICKHKPRCSLEQYDPYKKREESRGFKFYSYPFGMQIFLYKCTPVEMFNDLDWYFIYLELFQKLVSDSRCNKLLPTIDYKEQSIDSKSDPWVLFLNVTLPGHKLSEKPLSLVLLDYFKNYKSGEMIPCIRNDSKVYEIDVDAVKSSLSSILDKKNSLTRISHKEFVYVVENLSLGLEPGEGEGRGQLFSCFKNLTPNEQETFSNLAKLEIQGCFLDDDTLGQIIEVIEHDPPTIMKYVYYDYPIQKECEILKRLTHPNVIRVLRTEVIEDFEKMGIIMEYCQRGTLRKLIFENTIIYTMNTVISWGEQLFDALDYIFRRHMLNHGDIKPENIFVTEKFVLKVGDSGPAKFVEQTHQTIANGTSRYMSPSDETLIRPLFFGFDHPAKLEDSHRDDVYAMGLVLWELVERRIVFSEYGQPGSFDRDCFKNDIKQKRLVKLVAPNCQRAIQLIIEGCTNFDRHLRPTAKKVLEDLQLNDSFIASLEFLPCIEWGQRRILRPIGFDGTTARVPIEDETSLSDEEIFPLFPILRPIDFERTTARVPIESETSLNDEEIFPPPSCYLDDM